MRVLALGGIRVVFDEFRHQDATAHALLDDLERRYDLEIDILEPRLSDPDHAFEFTAIARSQSGEVWRAYGDELLGAARCLEVFLLNQLG